MSEADYTFFDDVDLESIDHRYTGPELNALLVEEAARPWIALRLHGEEIVRAPQGSIITLMAPTGGGKTSLATQFAWEHALAVGPVVFVSAELSAAEVGARIVGQRCGVSWEAALRNEVADHRRAEALALPRMLVLDDVQANLEALVESIKRLRSAYPNQPILCIVDYVQIMASKGDLRVQVAAVVEELRRKTKQHGVVTIAITQGSRASSRNLDSGSMTGAQTIDAGAETAQIERAAYITMALGNRRPLAGSTFTQDLNIGKERFGSGDRVYRVTFDGSTGLFRAEGPSVPADTLRAERHSVDLVEPVVDAVRARADGFESRNELSRMLGGNRKHCLAAIRLAFDRGLLRECNGRILAADD